MAVGRAGAAGAAYSTSSPSDRFGSLQALLLSFSHPCSWAFYAFPLRTAIFLTFTVVVEGIGTVTGSVKP